MNINAVNSTILLQEKKLALLRELRDSMQYETCQYDLRCLDSHYKRYSLFEISTGKDLVHGNIGRIAHYVRLRKIAPELIWNCAELVKAIHGYKPEAD